MALSLNTGPVSPETRAIALKELRENPDNVRAGLEELRSLLKADNTLYFKDDDETLTVFLRPCKWYAKSAFDLMKRIADFKKKYKDQVGHLLPEDVKDLVYTNNVVNILKDRDQKGRRVLIVNCGGSWDTDKVSNIDLFKMFFILQEAAVLEPENQVRGIVVIMDFNDLGMKQVKAFSPSFSFQLLNFIQVALPLRLKEIHMINEPMIFNIIWNIFKPLLKEKLKKRIFFHGSKMESLHKYLDPNTLPENYGGKLNAIDYTCKDWYPLLDEHPQHMQEWSKFGYKNN